MVRWQSRCLYTFYYYHMQSHSVTTRTSLKSFTLNQCFFPNSDCYLVPFQYTIQLAIYAVYIGNNTIVIAMSFATYAKHNFKHEQFSFTYFKYFILLFKCISGLQTAAKEILCLAIFLHHMAVNLNVKLTIF